MTSRIQEDGGGTESKWADIDDDEEDWAPETIEWNDGTKTDLKAEPAHPEPPPPISQPTAPKTTTESKEPFSPMEQPPAAKEAPKNIPKPVTSIGPNPTVLRLGASAERQARTASVSAKGSNDDKPPTSSTSPAPPAKSPWAPIPPIEKASPVMPPAQVQPARRTSFRENTIDGYSPPVPPKEIAADDFNRSWKETQTGTRELYNSRSGRYEPVPEPRKGSGTRNEQSFRATSVLQRPVAPGEQGGPAEPSAAFQTHRMSGQDGVSWNRRRTSSNVSGGSGSFGRRMSNGRLDTGQRPYEARRSSQVNGIPDPSLQAREHLSTESQLPGVAQVRHGHGPSWPSRDSATAPATGQPAPVPPSDGQSGMTQKSQEDALAMQERIMKEKRMEARQRRIEQEEKEEAAKRERIRQKLEAMGPPPDKSKTKSKESPEVNKAEPSTTGPVHSPPKPPVPEPSGAPKQYGMMKVHHPDTVKRLVERERGRDKPASLANVRRVSSPSEPKADAGVTNGLPQPHEPPQPIDNFATDQKVEDENSQWKGGINVSSTYSPWAANPKLVGATAPMTNPWKPLSNDKTLGNGIFEQSLGNFPSRDLNLRNHLGLDHSALSPSTQPFPTATRSAQESTTISPLPSPEARHSSYDALSPIARPGPIGPPRAQHPHWQHDVRTAAWNDFHAVATKREAEENERLRNEFQASRESQPSLPVTFNETWRQVRTGDQAGQRQIVGISRSADANAPLPNPLSSLEHPVGPLPFADAQVRPIASVPIRSSRFFPQATENRKPVYDDLDYQKSPSPPPPEEVSTHPVYLGASNRPLVHLPAPKPIVKLPPKVAVPPPPPPTFASMVASNTRPASSTTNWQERINTLFGKKTAVPDKGNALAVSSASKEPLDVPLHIASVSVSLPSNGEAQAGDGELTARQVEEAEEIFEDREVGSLPVVRVPTMAPPAAWRAAPAPSQARLRAKILKTMQVHSVEPFWVGYRDKDASPVNQVLIRLPGAVEAKVMNLPRKAAFHNKSGPRTRSMFKTRKGSKPHDGASSSNFNNKKAAQQQTSGQAQQRQSRKSSWDAPPTTSK